MGAVQLEAGWHEPGNCAATRRADGTDGGLVQPVCGGAGLTWVRLPRGECAGVDRFWNGVSEGECEGPGRGRLGGRSLCDEVLGCDRICGREEDRNYRWVLRRVHDVDGYRQEAGALGGGGGAIRHH